MKYAVTTRGPQLSGNALGSWQSDPLNGCGESFPSSSRNFEKGDGISDVSCITTTIPQWVVGIRCTSYRGLEDSVNDMSHFVRILLLFFHTSVDWKMTK